MSEQIKSKERVSEHGEVFTNEREVNAMLDLVKDESERIDSRFLEPACGNGNFVIEILRRKLQTVEAKYKKSKTDFEKYSIVAVSSIYGVDILEDNAKECRKRIYDFWNKKYTGICKKEANDECRESAKYIINHNILYGDALTMLRNDGRPIVFAQWDLVTGNKIKRRDYRLDQLMRDDTNINKNDGQMTLDMYASDDWEYDTESRAFVPKPIKEYPLVDYWEVFDSYEE